MESVCDLVFRSNYYSVSSVKCSLQGSALELLQKLKLTCSG